MYALIILFFFGIVSLFMGFGEMRKYAMPTGLLGILAAAGSLIAETLIKPGPYFNAMITLDHYYLVFGLLVLGFGALCFLLSGHYYRRSIPHLTDIYGLFLFSLTGALTLCAFTDLTMLFMGIEMMSIPVYVLAASHRDYRPSNEAGLKYFIMGAFSTGFLLFGITLIFGHTHQFNLAEIKAVIAAGNLPVTFKIGIILLLISMLFKVAVAPFHFWAPDVYHGAPSIVTVFMSTVVKTAAFAALYRFVNLCFTDHQLWIKELSIIVFITMILGNMGALVQTKFKRLMAYSGIANAGLMLLPILAFSPNSYQGLWIYLASYGAASMILFAIYMLTKDASQSEENSQFAGLISTHPFLAISGVAALTSMAGIPPMAGFFGKFLALSQAFREGAVVLGALALIFTILAVYYYLRIAVSMCTPADSHHRLQFAVPLVYKVVIAISLLLLFGLTALLSFI